MKPALERWLLQRWYGGQAPGFGLRFLAGIQRLIIMLRAALYSAGVLRSHRIAAPVIVIGNFTAGGTGKTPLIIALALRLQARGFKPGIVSRGYGRASQVPVQVDPDTSPALCGDEPKLIFERTRLPVFVDRDRVAAAQRALAAGCDVILADDGLQHRRLARDIEIEVLDGERRYGNGLLIPAGPLREAPRDTGFRVINGGTAASGEWPMILQLDAAVALASRDQQQALAGFIGAPVHALAGIGNPGRFFAALRQQGLEVVEHPFPDHHAYRVEDFAGMTGVILMTEKDAVKCRDLGLLNAWYVPVAAQLADEFHDTLAEKIKAITP